MMAENILKIAEGDPAVAHQYLDSLRRTDRLEPEIGLLRALLQDAIYDYRKYAHARDCIGRERFREAEAWLMGSSDDWIFSFSSVCEHLGLDPNYIRRGLREHKEAESDSKTSHSRAREHAA